MADDELEHRKKELTETEIAAKIAERANEARKVWLNTIFGLVGGTLGAIFSFAALLKFQNVPLSILGFVVMGAGYAIVTPAQVMKLASLRKGP